MAETLRDEIPPGHTPPLDSKDSGTWPKPMDMVSLNSLENSSRDVFRVEEGSLYPALQRMLLKGWVEAEWQKTENKRRARVYSLSALGASSSRAS